MHPAAFAWLNAKGALGILSAFSANPALTQLLAGATRSSWSSTARRNRSTPPAGPGLTGVLVDAMLIDSLGRSLNAPP